MLIERYRASERKACDLVGLSRTAWRYQPLVRDDEAQFRAEIIRLACTYGRYGYRMIAGLMRNAGWQQATQDRVRRIWKEEGLKVPDKQQPRGRLWLNDGSCIRLRPEHRNHVWSYDFVLIRDINGRKIRMLTMIDEYSRTCLVVHCARRIGADEVIEQLANAMIVHGMPEHIRSDNGPEFIANRLRDWLAHVGVKTAYIEPGSPWENGYCESFNGTLRDELLDGEIFYGIKEAQALVNQWVRHYNTTRPHSSLGYKPPAPEAIVRIPIQNLHPMMQ
jgi:transposase InsO family protein